MKQDTEGRNRGTAVAETATTGAEAANPVQGYVEGFGTRDVWGWVFSDGREGSDIQVRCDGNIVDVSVTWVLRPDVVAVLGTSQRLRGFQFRVPYEVSARLVQKPALAEETEVIVNGTPLPFAAGVAVTPGAVGQWANFPFECVLTTERAGQPVPVQVWSETPFRIRCRVEKLALAASDLRLLCNGEPIDSVVMVFPETTGGTGGDDTPALVASVCEFSLPGWIWEGDEARMPASVRDRRRSRAGHSGGHRRPGGVGLAGASGTGRPARNL
jgi:hypothetical protein